MEQEHIDNWIVSWMMSAALGVWPPGVRRIGFRLLGSHEVEIVTAATKITEDVEDWFDVFETEVMGGLGDDFEVSRRVIDEASADLEKDVHWSIIVQP